MKKTILITVVTSGLMLLASAPLARANSEELTVTSGVTLSGTQISPGNWLFDNSVGSWSLDVTAATGAPASGTFTVPNIDVDSSTINGSSVTAPLTIVFSQTGYTPTLPASFLAALTGINSGTASITYQTYFDTSDTLGAETTLLTSITQSTDVSSPGFTEMSYGTLPVGGEPISLTEVITIDPTSNPGNVTVSSLDANLSYVPDGGTTMMMLSGAFCAIGALRRKLGSK
jgi:hypothetical protein